MTRRRLRVGALSGIVFSGSLLVFGATNCAAPTQIRVDVRVEGKPLCDANGGEGKFIKNTGIAVTTPDEIDIADLTIFEGSGCDSPGDQIGVLTITPSADKDAEVGIRIVSGVTQLAQNCKKPKYEGCILAKRRVRFVANQTVTVTVIMGEKCLSANCGELECNPVDGTCVQPSQVQEDGAVTPPDSDSGKVDTGEPGDTSIPPLEAGYDACSSCRGGITKCDGVTGKCEITCGAGGACTGALCGVGIKDCIVDCVVGNSCQNAQCANTGGNCTFNCTQTGQQPRCTNIACSAQTCNVSCKDVDKTCNGVFLDGGTNTVDCKTGPTTATCDNVNCTSPNANGCTRTCEGADAAASCGPLGGCTPPVGCNAWVDGGGL